jgi:UDP-GlcNAc3NAcA epimerase
MKIVSIIGARPQFIKSAAVSRALKKYKNNFEHVKEIIVHTGQHYDKNMSADFFEELQIPQPDYNLEVGSGRHGEQTGLMLARIEEVLLKENPDWVIIYGDTNSTVAGALASTKLHIKTAHIEAGLRSYNRKMPEEINRLVSDLISDVLFAPTQNAMDILRKEGFGEKSIFTGDVMYDSFLFNKELAQKRYKLEKLTSLKKYYLATIHRPENTDNLNRLQNIFTAFSKLDLPVILPLHPRTKKIITKINFSDNVVILDPVGYLEMILLLKNCKKVLTDSGGLQKEAYFTGKACITLRDETEWIETLENNWNFIVGDNIDLIMEKISCADFGKRGDYFGDGNSAYKTLKFLISNK